MSGQDNDPDCRVESAYRFQEVKAVHARHFQIDERGIDSPFCQNGEGILPIESSLDMIVFLGKDPLEKREHDGLIIDQ